MMKRLPASFLGIDQYFAQLSFRIKFQFSGELNSFPALNRLD